jgi:hypothetical protein
VFLKGKRVYMCYKTSTVLLIYVSLFLIKHQPVLLLLSSLMKSGKSIVRVRGKKLKEKIHCHLGKGYFVTVNQFVMTIVECL